MQEKFFYSVIFSFFKAVLKYTNQKEGRTVANVSCIVAYLCEVFDGNLMYRFNKNA